MPHDAALTPGAWHLVPWSDKEAAIHSIVDGKPVLISGFGLYPDMQLMAQSKRMLEVLEKLVGVDPLMMLTGQHRRTVAEAREIIAAATVPIKVTTEKSPA